MEDIIISVPSIDASFVAKLMEKMGYYVKNKRLQGDSSKRFFQSFERARQHAAQDHEWTIDEINSEIAAARAL